MPELQTRRATVDLPQQQRDATFQPSSFNEAENTVDVVISAGARVRRYDWWNDRTYEEELAIEEPAIDLARVDAGTMQVLDNHDRCSGMSSVLGIVTSARIEGEQLVGTIRLSSDPGKAGIVGDIRAGVIRAISVGYQVARYEITKAADRTDGGGVDLWRATRWTPHEVSFVTVPADASASTRSQQAGRASAPCELFIRGDAASTQEHSMPEANRASPNPNDAPVTQPKEPAAPAATAADVSAERAAAAQAEQARAADITELCQRHNVAPLALGLIRSGSTVEQARAAVLDELARNDAAAGGHRNVRVETMRDEAQTRMAGLQEAILNRIDPRAQLTDNGRQYRGLSLIEIGRDIIEADGQSTRGMSRLEIATRMLQVRAAGYMGTSDFGSLISNVAGKRLRAAYEQAASTYRVWARQAPNAPDFKDITVVQLSGAPELLQTNEHGEFKYGTMSDGAEKYNVVTYGRIVALTRQAIINDDLRGFDRLVQAFGNSAARLENRLVYAQLTGNPTMADGVALFHATHGNLGTAGTVLNGTAKLGAARMAMRKQTGLQGEKLNVTPRYLIVPTALEQTAYQYTSSAYVPAIADNVNEFRAGGRTALEPVVEPLLDDASATAWYLAADAAAMDTVEYCYLDGAEGPVIESEMGFEVDGVSLKARLDFAAKAVEHRGLYKATGAA